MSRFPFPTQHVKNVLTKMKRNCNLMRLGKNLLSKQGLKTVYYAHVYSHLSYCISIWGSMIHASQLAKLRSQQDKCMRLIDSKLSADQVYTKYKVLKIEQVIDLELCIMGFKVHLGDLPENLLATIKSDAKGSSLRKTHRYNTRQKNESNLPLVSKKNITKVSYFKGSRNIRLSHQKSKILICITALFMS